MPDRAPLFFFGAMSPYSWFAAERIDGLLADAQWRGVFAGAVFKAAGRVSWGLTERRAAGIADCEERAAILGLGPIRWPERWPTNDLLVARAMAHLHSQQLLKRFALEAMRLCFLEGRDLGTLDSVLEAGARAGIAAPALEAALGERSVKDSLRALTEEAITRGVFGVPTVVLDVQSFWGEDRLEDAAAAAARP
ncbi:MAG: 2-hydroxychromene-2-carboxylate isomerase [Solirubrobacteraceae bacterium]